MSPSCVALFLAAACLAVGHGCAATPYGSAVRPTRDIGQMSAQELETVPLHWLCVALNSHSSATVRIREEMTRRGVAFTADESFLLEHTQGVFLGMSAHALECASYPWKKVESWTETWGSRSVYADEQMVAQVVVDSGSVTAIRVCDVLDRAALQGRRRVASSLGAPRLFRSDEVSDRTFSRYARLDLVLADGREVSDVRLERIDGDRIVARSGKEFGLGSVRFVRSAQEPCPKDRLEEWWEWIGPF